MPIVEEQITVDAAIQHVWGVAKDVEAFPNYMPDVESVAVLERSEDGSHTITAWVGLIPEFRQKIRWTEEDTWNDAGYICKFAQVKGDYKQYEGEWVLTAVTPTSTLFRSTLTYEIEIPLIGPLIKKLIAKKVLDNMRGVLSAIKSQAESTG